nr:EOG090X0D3U [Macrothrix elegans]
MVKSERKNVLSIIPSRTFCQEPENTASEYKFPHVALNEDVIKTLTEGDPELIKRLKVIEFEYEVAKQEGARTPSRLTLEQWKELLRLPSLSGRKKYLTFLFKVEMTKINEKKKKEKEKIRREAEREASKAEPSETEEHIPYGLGKNTIMLKVYDNKMDYFNNYKMIRSYQFDQPVVYDLGFDQNMTAAEQKNTAKQLMLAFVACREHEQPLPMHFCNVNVKSGVFQQLLKLVPTLHLDEFPITLSPKSYLDVFPKEKLIYLTPHCRTEMTEFDPDSIYIVGGIVDKSDSTPLSLAKAKKDNIRMEKLPLDRYLSFAGGSGKSLTLNAMMSILLELRMHGNWQKALQFVPRRKLRRDDEEPNTNFKKYPQRNVSNFFTSSDRDVLFANVPSRANRTKSFEDGASNFNKRKQ